jgi:hypothetical protein
MKEVILVLILMLFILSLGSLAAAGNRYVRNSETIKEEQRSAFSVLNSVTERMQAFTKQDADIPEADVLTGIEEDFCNSNLKISDVSSGINMRFFPERILADEKIKTLVSVKDESSPEVSYGWINITTPNRAALAAAEKSFATDDVGNLFPLVNTMPLTNVYYLSDACLAALLDALSVKSLPRRTAFLAAVKNRELKNNDDIKKILGITHNAAALCILGVKTSFWKVTFTSGRFIITGIYAAVPDRTTDSFAVQKYILVERYYAVP